MAQFEASAKIANNEKEVSHCLRITTKTKEWGYNESKHWTV